MNNNYKKSFQDTEQGLAERKYNYYKFFRNLLILLCCLFLIFLFSLKLNAQVITAQQDNDTDDCPTTDQNHGYVTQGFSGYDKDYYLSSVTVHAKRNGPSNPLTGTTTVAIFGDYGYPFYGYKEFSNSILDTSYSRIELDFSDLDILIQNNENYDIVAFPDPALARDTVDFAYYKYDDYDGGDMYCSGKPWEENMDIKFQIKGYPIDYIKAIWGIPTVYASTTCDFVTDGATTTATCSDASFSAINISANIYYGFVLFFITFFGLLFYFRGERR